MIPNANTAKLPFSPATAEAVIVELDFCNIEMVSALEKSYKFMTENKLAEGNR